MSALAGAAEIAVVEQVYDAFRRGEPGAFLDLLADDVVFEQWSGVPWGGRAEGRQAAIAFAQAAGSHISSQQAIDEYVLAGDEVIAIGRSRGTAVRTGRAFDVRIVHRWRIADGRIRFWGLFVEVAPLLAALGADAEERA